MRNERLVVSRERLLEEVWGYDPMAMTNTIDVFISNLRRKLEEGGEPRLLHTKRGAGYVLRARDGETRLFRHWPVRWRIAGVSAGLTLLILLGFALSSAAWRPTGSRATSTRSCRATANQLAIERPARRSAQLRSQDIGDGRATASSGSSTATATPLAGHSGRRRPRAAAAGETHAGRRLRGRLAAESSTERDSGARLLRPVRRDPRRRSTRPIDRALAAARRRASSAARPRAARRARGRRPRDAPDRRADRGRARDRRRPAIPRGACRRPRPTTRSPSSPARSTRCSRELDAARAETQQMIQAQRDFVADASHELRTPLTSILANLELLEASLAERGADPEEEEIVAGALGSSRRMRRLVSDLLLLARADAGRAGPAPRLRPGRDRRPPRSPRSRRSPASTSSVLEDRRIGAGRGQPRRPPPAGAQPARERASATPRREPGARSRSARDGERACSRSPTTAPGSPTGIGDQIFARFVRGDGPGGPRADSGHRARAGDRQGGRDLARRRGRGRALARRRSAVQSCAPAARRAERSHPLPRLRRSFSGPLHRRLLLVLRTRHRPSRRPPTKSPTGSQLASL